jgi:hypothetical protein
MARKQRQPKEQPGKQDNSAVKEPEEWKTGDEPMTGAQRSYLDTLAHEAGEKADDDLTKAEAARRIEELQEKTGRGLQTRKRRRS